MLETIYYPPRVSRWVLRLIPSLKKSKTWFWILNIYNYSSNFFKILKCKKLLVLSWDPEVLWGFEIPKTDGSLIMIFFSYTQTSISLILNGDSFIWLCIGEFMSIFDLQFLISAYIQRNFNLKNWYKFVISWTIQVAICQIFYNRFQQVGKL